MRQDYRRERDAYGPWGQLMEQLNPDLEESAVSLRYRHLISQYIAIRSNVAGLCGEPGTTFKVSSTVVHRYMNGLGIETGSHADPTTYSYFSVPARFGGIVNDASLTKVDWVLSSGIKRLIDSEGGCGSDVLAQMETNMLTFYSADY